MPGAILCAQPPTPTEKKVQDPISVAEEQAKGQRNVTITPQAPPASPAQELEITYDRVEGQGDVIIYSGNVEAHYTDLTVFADRVTYNDATKDIIAEGEVFFEQQGQILIGERLELNLRTKRGTFFQASGFTDRTPDGTRIVIDSTRADKTSADTYLLANAVITSCQERVPKWSFTARRARIKVNERATVYHALVRIKNLPVFYLPYASVPISQRDRGSGFLLPGTGSSNIKGRTFYLGYYQTLGRSADVRVRTDLYTKRGIGLALDFRARTDEHSRIDLGGFLVFDRLLGPKRDAFGNDLPDQGGSSFYADAVQYFKNGFVAVADVNVTSNFDFRQVFAESLAQALSPEERSLVYINRNWRSYSFNASFGEQSAFIGSGIVKTRALPSFELSKQSTPISDAFPAYFSFDATAEGVRRTESVGREFNLKTPSVVQRLDFSPRLTLPLRALAGFTLTPTLGLRTTFYSDSLDPVKRQVVGQNLNRNYGELSLDLRPPSLSRIFRRRDGSPRFKHLIEPYLTYRKIAGIDDFARTIRFDERDLIANTNELEYGVTNRFFVRRPGPDGSTPQAHELLELTIAQKYFFDPSFGGALVEGVRNQFYPLNTLSGFAYGGVSRRSSPLNVRARLRPSPFLFSDLRANYDPVLGGLRDLIAGGGFARGLFSASSNWIYTRQIRLDGGGFDPSTLPGNQLDVSAFAGNPARGPYGGLTLIYDFRNRNFDGTPRDPTFVNLTTTAGWAWDCCSLQLQNITFKAGVRNENRLLFAFTFKGIGTVGSDTFGQRR
jgi:LPS-assembly protein